MGHLQRWDNARRQRQGVRTRHANDTNPSRKKRALTDIVALYRTLVYGPAVLKKGGLDVDGHSSSTIGPWSTTSGPKKKPDLLAHARGAIECSFFAF